MSRLIDAIKEYQEVFKTKAPVEVQEIMKKATKKLEDASISKNALKVGDSAKDFTLKNVLANDVSLSDVLKDNNFAVVSFYRGTWCPYCNLELKALQGINEELKALGVSLIAISPQTPDASLSTKEKNELTFEVLSDNSNTIAKDYGLVFSLDEALRPIYKSFNIDVPVSNGDDSYDLPMPATYVINKNKEIVFSFIDEDYTKRCEPQDIIEAIKKNS